ncbi:ABC transporter ATP-binding protein [Nocardia sp. BMG51109]|uniref:ABC transporter ATP-binding protein n=1 Tax=Nocardia sp. BMG51109 TaxID=1056816 RepID=UPI000466537F|nr:ATP-binding cassette domain-containing protein [Nocardia sp. BMG51109]
MIAVERLSVRTPGGATLLAPISLRVPEGGIAALRGPSGCGKSTLLKALLGHVPAGTTATGTVRVGEHDVLALESVALRRFRRHDIAFVGQDPGVALNPTMRVRSLLGELADRDRAMAALAAVELPESYLRRRPAELSGGEQRRIALARALARRTPVLVLDEPLAGLHGRLRTAVVRLLSRLSDEHGVTLVVSGHDTATLRELTDRHVTVGDVPRVDGGRGRGGHRDGGERDHDEQPLRGRIPGPRDNGARPALPQTLESGEVDANRAAEVPAPPVAVSADGVGEQVLSMSGMCVAIDRRQVLGDIDLRLAAGEALAVTGPSGAGKSTLARAAVGLRRPAAGTVRAAGRIGLVPQDSAGSLNPRRTVAQTLSRPLRRHRGVRGPEVTESIAELLRTVELKPELAHRYPHELSGGQRQRVALARALALDPAALVCDEITSALDSDTAEAIMTLLDRLRRDRGLALLVITHDIDLAARYCTRMTVLDSGRIAEFGPLPDLLAAPTHDATLALLG